MNSRSQVLVSSSNDSHEQAGVTSLKGADLKTKDDWREASQSAMQGPAPANTFTSASDKEKLTKFMKLDKAAEFPSEMISGY